MAELFSGRICLGFAESGISNGAMWSVPELGKKLALGDEIPRGSDVDDASCG